MATPDPSTLKSSAEIFSSNHTLPQIRSIHKSIHVQIDEKATRLRTQVGKSYRELLGTADTIVRMRDDNDAVQELLGHMGGRCGRAVVESKVSGLARFSSGESKPGATETARLKLLESSLLAASRILKGSGGLPAELAQGDRLVLAAKVWVLSRLLIKSLGDPVFETGLRSAVQTANRTLASLRRRLLGVIKHLLERTDDNMDKDDVLKALCAYSLATSSGAQDVLRHFLVVRGEAIQLAFELDEGERGTTTEDVIQSLKLYTRTILDVQALVPARLSPALLALKQRPLLADEALKQLEGLRLDIYQRWSGDDIEYFTPFIRHDDLDGKQARDRLSRWAENGAEVLLDGLKKTLAQMVEFKSVVELRTGVLQVWIRDGGRAKGFDPQEMQDDLRAAINNRLLAVLVSKVSKLRLVGSEVKATIESWKSGVTDKAKSLWDETYDFSLAQGAGPFVEEVVSRFYGRSDAVSRAMHCYQSWFHVIDDVKDVVEMLRKQRWDNDYEEIEDEETIEARQQLLTKDDPKVLQDRLDTALDKSFRELQSQLETLWSGVSESEASSNIAVYFLRVLRDIREQLPKRRSVEAFGLSMVPPLHERLATFVSTPALAHFSSNGLTEKHAVGRPLWEGEPPLPSQPSPGFFQFLRDLSLSMLDAGGDLWTATAVKVLKQHLSKELCKRWSEAIGVAEAGISSGGISVRDEDADEKDEETEERNGETSNEASKHVTQKQDLFLQWYLDVSLLMECLTDSTKIPGDALDSLREDIYKRSGLTSDDATQRMRKAAHAFWQRTRLLFGLLA